MKFLTNKKKTRHYRIMASPKRKTRDWVQKKRVIDPRYSYQQRYKRQDIPRRGQPINVPELVYRLLTIDNHNQSVSESEEEKVARRRRSKFYDKMSNYENNGESSYDVSDAHGSTESIEGSEYTETGGTSRENLTEGMEATNSLEAASSENSSISNISVEPITLANSIDSARALLKKKSLLEIINNYITTGIDEGKRRAKKYIRKALSFGMKSGYLIPADRKGQMIHVSPTLLEFRTADSEARKRRRRARRGEDEPRVLDRKYLRRNSSAWVKKDEPSRRESSVDMVVPKKRRKTSESRSPRRILNRGKANSRNPIVNLAPRKRAANRKLTTPRKKRNEKVNKKGGKLQDKYKSGGLERKSIQKRRVVKSSPPRKSKKDNCSKGHRSQHDGDQDSIILDEINQSVVTEQQKTSPLLKDCSRSCEEMVSTDIAKKNAPESSNYEIHENIGDNNV